MSIVSNLADEASGITWKMRPLPQPKLKIPLALYPGCSCQWSYAFFSIRNHFHPDVRSRERGLVTRSCAPLLYSWMFPRDWRHMYSIILLCIGPTCALYLQIRVKGEAHYVGKGYLGFLLVLWVNIVATLEPYSRLSAEMIDGRLNQHS